VSRQWPEQEILRRDLHLAVVLAAAFLLMVQVSIDQVVGVIAMWDSFVSASRAVFVVSVVGLAFVPRLGDHRILDAHAQPVLVDVSFMNIVQMAVVQVVGVAFVFDGGVPASRTVLVRVVAVNFAFVCHAVLL
jgi:hypothetical protein